MAKRRGNHEGSIYQLPSGSWRAQVSLQGHRLNFTAHTRKECYDWLRNINRQIDDGLTFSSTKILFSDFLTTWLKNTKPSLRYSTQIHYEHLCTKYILPNIGNIHLRELEPEHIQELYNRLLDQKVGVFTVLKIHAVLHRALQWAVKIGSLSRNPASLTHPPKKPSREMSILDEDQINQLMIAASGHRLQALIHLAVVSGMRQMELLGLRWDDINWDRNTIRVERQLVRPDGNGIQFSPPKTNYGKRCIALGEYTIDMLRGYFEHQQVDRLAAGEKWQEHGLIFANSLGGPIHPRNLLRDFKKMLRDAGLPPIRFHDLRHSSASIMLNNNIPPIVVSRRLGHAKTSTTLDIYGHLLTSMQDGVAEKIDQLITPISMIPPIKKEVISK